MGARHFVALMLAISIGASGEWAHCKETPVPTPESTARFKHYVIITDGIAGPATEEFGVRRGHAVFSIKVWANSTAEAARMARLFARRAGYRILGGVEVYSTGTIGSPPRMEPYGYDPSFYPYNPNKKD